MQAATISSSGTQRFEPAEGGFFSAKPRPPNSSTGPAHSPRASLPRAAQADPPTAAYCQNRSISLQKTPLTRRRPAPDAIPGAVATNRGLARSDAASWTIAGRQSENPKETGAICRPSALALSLYAPVLPRPSGEFTQVPTFEQRNGAAGMPGFQSGHCSGHSGDGAEQRISGPPPSLPSPAPPRGLPARHRPTPWHRRRARGRPSNASDGMNRWRPRTQQHVTRVHTASNPAAAQFQGGVDADARAAWDWTCAMGGRQSQLIARMCREGIVSHQTDRRPAAPVPRPVPARCRCP